MAANVECLLEDTVIPGVTKATVLHYLESKYHADGNKVVYGRSQVRCQPFLHIGSEASTHMASRVTRKQPILSVRSSKFGISERLRHTSALCSPAQVPPGR